MHSLRISLESSKADDFDATWGPTQPLSSDCAQVDGFGDVIRRSASAGWRSGCGQEPVSVNLD